MASSAERAWWSNMAFFLLHGLVVGTWVSRIPAVQTKLHLANAVLGTTLLSAAVGALVSIPFTGRWIAREGSKTPCFVSSVLFSLALVFLGLASNAFTLAASLLFYGGAAGCMDVSMNAQGVEIEKRLCRPVMSRFHAMFSVGAMGGAALGGSIASHGIEPLAHFATSAGVYALFCIVATPWLVQEGTIGSRSREWALRITQIPPLLLALTAIGFCMLLAEGAMADWSGVYLERGLHAKAGIAALGYALFSAAMATFRFGGDFVTSRLGPFRAVLSGSLVGAAGLLGVLSAPSAAFALPAFLLVGAGFSIIIPLVFGSGGRVEGINPGTGIATVTGLGYSGFIIGPPLIGFLSQQITLRYAMGVVLICCFITAALSRSLRHLPAPGGQPSPALESDPF